MKYDEEKEYTGYPSIDKPWLKYYSKGAIKKQLIPDTIYGHLWENNKEHLDDIACIYFQHKYKYRELFSLIDKCKISLIALGIKKGDIITIQTLAIPQTVVLLYALSRIGAVANLTYVSSTESETNKILKQTNSRAYFVIDSVYEKYHAVLNNTCVENVVLLSVDSEMDFVTKTIYRISNMKWSAENKDKILLWPSFMKLQTSKKIADVKEDNLPAVMVYTGGTTGTSKVVVLTNRSINELVFQYEKSDMGFMRQDVFMDSLPLFIAFGLTVGLHLPLCMGIKTVLIPEPMPQNQGKMFIKYKPNYYVAGPVQVEAIINHARVKKSNLAFLKILATGGDELPAATEERINDFLKEHNCNTSVVQGYGMTELAATVCTGSATIQRFGTVGIPLPNTNIKIIDDSGEEVSYGQQGEICISAPSVMAGYYNNPEETEKILRQHNDGLKWIHTGDIGIIDVDGYLSIVGRIKRMILVKENGDSIGYVKVFPKILEERIETVVGVKSATIVGDGKSADEQKLIAFIVSDDDPKILENKIRMFVSDCFKDYEQPVEYRFISQLPRTKIGKIDYRALECDVNKKNYL